MKFDLFNIIVVIFMIYVLYRLPSIEKMTNVDKATEEKIREIYKIDTDAIRNLSNLARNLTVDGKLVVPGGLEVKGDFKVEGNSEVLKQTTIHELYGGKSTWGGWRNIVVNGGHLMFDVGNKGYGMHSNENGLHYKVNNAWQPLHIYGGVHSIGNLSTTENLNVSKDINLANDLKMQGGKTIHSTGRLHIHPQERLYLLAKGNTFITGDWGGNGNVHTSGEITSKYLNIDNKLIVKPIHRHGKAHHYTHSGNHVWNHNGNLEVHIPVGVWTGPIVHN